MNSESISSNFSINTPSGVHNYLTSYISGTPSYFNSSMISNSGVTYNGGVVANTVEVKEDITINGKSLTARLEAIEHRLSILNPDPEKLAKYEALQKAYERYQIVEALCYGTKA